MTSGTERILGMMGLSFSMSNELWIKVVRFWKQVLIHHQQQPQQEAAATSLQQVQQKVSYIDILLVNGSNKASLAPLKLARFSWLPAPWSYVMHRYCCSICCVSECEGVRWQLLAYNLQC